MERRRGREKSRIRTTKGAEKGKKTETWRQVKASSQEVTSSGASYSSSVLERIK